ncbi:MAG: hypothetical protein ACOYZ7_03060 [Chloroflexota bacterium]
MSASAILGLIGLVALSFGLYIRAGGFKAWYLIEGESIHVRSETLRNILIPLGVTFMVWAIAWSDLISDTKVGNKIFGYVVMPMFVACIVLSVWNPRWLRPRWLVYLEEEYGTVMWRLLDEARKNPREWEQQVRTKEGLEQWAKETREKLGYPPHPGCIEREAKKRRKRR